MFNHINTMPGEILWEIAKSLTLQDLVNLKQSNKRLHQFLTNRSAVEYFCQQQNLPVFLPKEQEKIYSALLGEHYYQQADLYKKKIAECLRQENEWILIHSTNNSVYTDRPSELSRELQKAIENYDFFMQQAQDLHHFMAVVTACSKEKTLQLNPDFQSKKSAFIQTEQAFVDLEKKYGASAQIFHILTLFSYASIFHLDMQLLKKRMYWQNNNPGREVYFLFQMSKKSYHTLLMNCVAAIQQAFIQLETNLVSIDDYTQWCVCQHYTNKQCQRIDEVMLDLNEQFLKLLGKINMSPALEYRSQLGIH